MHEFRFKRNELFCEDLKVKEIALRFGTPLYLYSSKTILDHFYKIKHAFKELNPLICYSMKANSNLAVLYTLMKAGSGFDIVSGGELYRAKTIAAPPEKIVYASVGKTEKEIREAIKYGILLFNVESMSELSRINEIAHNLRRIQQVCLRINPGVAVPTHPYIRTAHLEEKFGIDFETAREILKNRKKFKNLKIVGLHLHIGSQITQASPFIKAIEKVIKFIKTLKGIQLKFLNIGGGWGIVYRKERPQTAEEFANRVLPLLKGLNLKLIIEPGRFIVGNGGILVTQVLYIKETKTKRFVIVDAGMNDLIRPALYNAYHQIIPVTTQQSPLTEKYDVVGPVCESGDFLGKNRKLSGIKEGDYLAVMGAGAYGASMSSNYNSRPLAAEVMVIKGRPYLVRKRESLKDLIRNEIII